MSEPSQPAADCRSGWLQVLALFLASRVLFYGAAVVLPYLLLPGPMSAGLAHQMDWAHYWLRWDANWYTDIAQHGYYYEAGARSSVAFFPLLPLLIRALGFLGLPSWLGGLVVANLATLGLLLLFHGWLRREFARPAVADTATALLAFCPQSCWLILGYTEPLYLLTALGALAAARQGRWRTSFLWSVAHGLTRANAITLALPLLCLTAPALLAAWRTRAWRELFAPGLATIGAWIGHASYLAYLWLEFGTWQAYQITNRAGWNVALALDREHLHQKLPIFGFRPFTNFDPHSEWIVWSWLLALAVTLFALAVFVEKRLPLFWSACLLAFWSLFLLTAEGSWLTGSMGRFAAALFPVAVAQALFAEKRPWAQPVFLACNAGAAFINIALVFSGYHIV